MHLKLSASGRELRGILDGLVDGLSFAGTPTTLSVDDKPKAPLPGAMNTESWVRGLLLPRKLLQLKKLTWSQCKHAVTRYFASIQALRDPETTAFETLLDVSTPYPHLRIHHEMGGDSPEELDATSREIARHISPWGDAPAPPPAVTVEVVWQTACGWANAREAEDWSAAVSLKRALAQQLEQADVPELRELLTMPDVDRRTRMRALGVLPVETELATVRAPLVPSPVLTTEPERVSHTKFGPGEVLSRQGTGGLAIVEVRFADALRTSSFVEHPIS